MMGCPCDLSYNWYFPVSKCCGCWRPS